MRASHRFWFAAAFGCICLSGAAVWIGGLNQDEGWYLYAANLVREGQCVYRDFAFTQGPVMPRVYAAFAGVWQRWGILGGRVFTLTLGFVGIAFAMLLARHFVTRERRNEVALVVAFLLGCNLYHLYYLAIPKTYALASLFVLAGFWCLAAGMSRRGRDGMCGARRAWMVFLGGSLLALAAGVRISLGAILPLVGVWLIVSFVRSVRAAQCVSGAARPSLDWLWFGLGGAVGLVLSYGFVLFDPLAFKGFLAAQAYHAARGGTDLTWVVGSLSRLVRWYLPVFIILGLGIARRASSPQDVFLPLLSFVAVFVVQMLAPFPYEDYQVPIMGLLAVVAAATFVNAPGPDRRILLVFGLAYATSFGSPLLEKWSTNGQDRFWSLKKKQYELAQLHETAQMIERLDPGGTMLLTQDMYLAIETNRKVPKGLEMGPFSQLTDGQWRELITSAPCPIAAVSGYTFAIEPPACAERPLMQQMAYWKLLKERYALVLSERDFGQNATTLLVLKRK